MIVRATAWVVLQPIAGGSGAGPSGIAAAKKKAAPKQREERMPTLLFIPPRDRWGEIYYPLPYPLSLDAFQAEKARGKIVMDRWMKK